MTFCKCGCNKIVNSPDKRGRIRFYIVGHHHKNKTFPFKERPKAKGRNIWNKGKKMPELFCKKVSAVVGGLVTLILRFIK